MKKWISLLLLPVFLIGCGQQETLETVSDEYVQPVVAAMQQAAVLLPEDAAVAVMTNEQTGTIYFCDDYTVTLQTFASGDLNRTLQAVTGYEKSQLQLIQTEPAGNKRYDCVWSCAGESEEQVGRAAVLDDGNYHYVLTCMAGCSRTQALRENWDALFSSFCLTAPGENPYTGS